MSGSIAGPIHADTRVHTQRRTAMGPDLHPTVLASAREGADGVAGLSVRLTPRGSSFAPLMLKNQSGMNHHRESWRGMRKKRWKGRRKEKREEKVQGMIGTQGDTEVRGWMISTEEPPGQGLGVQGTILVHSSLLPYNCH